MSKQAVLISIRPEWVEKILSGEKTVEIRKRKPHFPDPFKCYIYCTKGGDEKWLAGVKGGRESYKMNGTVCAEFTCDSIQEFSCPFPAYSKEVDQTILKDACIAYVWAHLYLGHKSGYAWHISDVKVYDKPKEVSTFYKWDSSGNDIRPCVNGRNCEHIGFDYSEDCEICKIDYDGENCPFLKLSRPPQSWCYVEKI